MFQFTLSSIIAIRICLAILRFSYNSPKTPLKQQLGCLAGLGQVLRRFGAGLNVHFGEVAGESFGTCLGGFWGDLGRFFGRLSIHTFEENSDFKTIIRYENLSIHKQNVLLGGL